MEPLLLAPIFLLAAFVQSAVGFGFGMVCMGLLPVLLPMGEAVTTTVLLSALNCAVLFWRLRAGLRREEIVPLLAGAVVGAPIGVVALKHLDPRWLVLVVSVALMGYAVWGLASRGALLPRGTPRFALPVGIVAGVLGGAAGTSGPPAVMYLSWRALPREVTAATLQTLFLALAVVQIGGYAITDQLTAASVLRAAWALPAIAAGLFVGQLVFKRLSGPGFRRATLVGLLVLGVWLLGRVVVSL